MAGSTNSDRAAAFLKLIATPDLPALGPEIRRGIQSVAEIQRALDGFLGPAPADTVRGDTLRGAALWWHDHLDAAHALAQV